MAAGSAEIRPEGTWGPGIMDLPERGVSGSLSRVVFEYDCTLHTDPNIIVEAILEWSNDQGASWILNKFRFVGAPGGSFMGPSGIVQTKRRGAFGMTPGPQRRIKGSVEVTGGALAIGPGGMWALWE